MCFPTCFQLVSCQWVYMFFNIQKEGKVKGANCFLILVWILIIAWNGKIKVFCIYTKKQVLKANDILRTERIVYTTLSRNQQIFLL